MGRENAVVVDHDAAAFLSPVLEGVEPVVNDPSHIGGRRTDDAEYAAFFMDRHRYYLTIKK